MWIKIVPLTASHCQVVASPEAKSDIDNFFSFFPENYQFTKQFKERKWSGKVRLYSAITGKFYVGLLPELIRLAQFKGWRYDLSEMQFHEYDESKLVSYAENFIKNNPGSPFKPRDYQIKSLIRGVKNGRNTFLSATGSGKSGMIFLLCDFYFDKKILVIAPRTTLVNQLAKELDVFSVGRLKDTHKIYAGQEKVSDSRIIFSTWQSIYLMPKKYFEQFDMVIVDECHESDASSLKGIMNKCVNAHIRFGFTGTLKGAKSHEMIITGVFGPVETISETHKLIERGILSEIHVNCIILKHPIEYEKRHFQDEVDYICRDKLRNTAIAKFCSSLPGNTLMMTHFVDKHGMMLYDLIKKYKDPEKVFFINGRVDVDIRDEIKSIIEKSNDATLIATYGAFQLGENVTRLHNVAFTTAYKARVQVLQSIGRGTRRDDYKGGDKFRCDIWDFADDLTGDEDKLLNYGLKHLKARIKIYAEQKFPYKVTKIEL